MPRDIFVSRHAVMAYARRRYAHTELEAFERVDWHVGQLSRLVGSQEASRLMLAYNGFAEEIREQVRCGLEAGTVLDHKPPGFILYGRRSAALPQGQRFVWCGDEPQVGFVLKRDPDGPDVVMTTLNRVGVRR